jgi:phosphoglycolate phosphatase-like HAD superfamily hydrolase
LHVRIEAAFVVGDSVWDMLAAQRAQLSASDSCPVATAERSLNAPERAVSTKTRPISSNTSMRSVAGVEAHMDGPGQTAQNAIELRIEEISQLFDSLDPFPFRERDLDKEAEEFIVGWARELSLDRPIKIVVHLLRAST